MNKPNILLIGVDQLRFDTLGCNGNLLCKTPNLDKLAAKSVNFTNAYTTCSLCSPARASMFTGRFAFNHGMGTNCDLYHPLSEELNHPEMLLHRDLLEKGYMCGYVGKWHVGTNLGPCDYGFEGMNLPGYGNLKKDDPNYISHLKDIGFEKTPIKNPVYANPGNKTLIAGCWDGPVETTPAWYLADNTCNMITEYARKDKPFFLTCQFWGPHQPHLPSREYYNLHDRKKINEWPNFNDELAGKPNRVKRDQRDFYRKLPEQWQDWREIVGTYYDFTSMIDAQVGRIIDCLEELHLTEKTIIFFTSDHGEMLGSHGLFDKGFMYEEAHRIPFMVSCPLKFKPRESKELVYNMDIMPTVLEINGICKNSVDGKSLHKVLAEDNESLRDSIYLEFHGKRSLYTQRAVVTKDGWKYIFTPGDFDELYNLNEDPAELYNLIFSQKHVDIIKNLREKLLDSAIKYNDPVRDNISKLFGKWEKLSGQHDSSSQWLN